MSRTRIFIVHENQTVASQAMTQLAKEAGFYAGDIFHSVNEALSFIGNGNCDVLLVSSRLPNDGAIHLLRKLRKAEPQLRILVTGLPNQPGVIVRFMAAGAAGYILAEEPLAQWTKYIRAAAEGRSLISPAVTAMMIEQISQLSRLTARYEPKSTLFADLTEREVEILKMLATGCSNQKIADTLIITVGTVKNHVHRVLKKLNLRSRKDASTYLAFVNGSQPPTQIAAM
jgi:DNA-binding NarL/FixJ family response regulator